MSRVVISGESRDYFNTIEGELYSSRFNTCIRLYGKHVGEDYLTRCAAYFEKLPEDIMLTLCSATAEYLNDLIEEHSGEFVVEVPEFDSGSVKTFLAPVELHTEPMKLLSEEDSPAAFSVKLVFTPVPDECVEWVVRGDSAIYAGEYHGYSPWDDRITRKSWNYIQEG